MEPDYFHLGSDAETVACDLETYEQTLAEAYLFIPDPHDPTNDE